MFSSEQSNSLSVLIEFEGVCLPSWVGLGYLSFPVRSYVRPPLRCYNCQCFGHVAAVCRGKRRCGRCGGDHESLESVRQVLLHVAIVVGHMCQVFGVAYNM